jgi:3-phosphoshikimate 1-carboxyvinyltransferase
LRVRGSSELRGEVAVPGDKSISHRAVVLGAIAEGETPVRGFLAAEDTLNTARALQAMGVEIEGLGESEMLVHGVGLRGLRKPAAPLDLGNSGTGMRLLMGVLAGQEFRCTRRQTSRDHLRGSRRQRAGEVGGAARWASRRRDDHGYRAGEVS